MALPQISYGQAAGVRVPTGTAGVGFEAAAGAADVLSKGFAEMGQEHVRVEQTEADLRAAEGLAELDVKLAEKKDFTPDEVRAAFGGVVPPSVERHLTIPGADGEMTDTDRVSAWKVAGAMYEAQAKQIVEKAAGSISTGPGWKKAFSDRAAEVVFKKKTEFAGNMMKQFVDGSRTATMNQVDRYKNLGMFDMATAAVQSAKFFDKAEKEKVLYGIRNEEQTSPVFKAMESNDLGKLNAQLTLLKGTVDEKTGERDPNTDKFDTVDEKQRSSLINALESQIKAIEYENKTREKKLADAREGEMWQKLATVAQQSKMSGRPVSTKDFGLLTPYLKDPATAEFAKQGFLFLSGLAQGEEKKTDDALYYRVAQSQAAHPEEFAKGRVNVNAGVPGAKEHFVSFPSLINRFASPDFQAWSDRISGAARDTASGRPPSVSSPLDVFNATLAKYEIPLPKGDDEAGQANIGALKRAVDVSLSEARRGQKEPLAPEQENKVIDGAVSNFVQQRKNAWYQFGKKNKIVVGERPELAQALHTLAQRRGEKLDPARLENQMKDFDAYAPAIVSHWTRRKGNKVLSEVEAAKVYGIIYSDSLGLSRQIRGFDKMSPAQRQDAMATLATEKYLRGM